jgi:membrane-associated phospholipid phosphatase
MSVYSTGSLVLSIIFLWIFAETADGVFTGDILLMIDQWVASHIVCLRSAFLTSSMQAATNFGGIKFIAPIGLFTAAYFLIKKHYDRAIGLAITVSGGKLLNNILKLIFQRPRPFSETSLITTSGWSFPSGHSMNSMIFYGILVYLFMREDLTWPLRILIMAAACSVILTVGISRIYLKVHYTSDVIAGFLGGLFWLCFCMAGIEIYRKRKDTYDLQGL